MRSIGNGSIGPSPSGPVLVSLIQIVSQSDPVKHRHSREGFSSERQIVVPSHELSANGPTVDLRVTPGHAFVRWKVQTGAKNVLERQRTGKGSASRHLEAEKEKADSAAHLRRVGSGERQRRQKRCRGLPQCFACRHPHGDWPDSLDLLASESNHREVAVIEKYTEVRVATRFGATLLSQAF